VAYFASRLVGAVLEWYTVEVAAKTKTKADEQFLPIIKRVIYAVIFGLMLLVIMGQLGIEITTLIAAMGIGGLAIALALQPTLANFFSGMQMVLDRPIKIGDYVELDSGDKGTVVDIGWRSTRVQTYTNNIVTIPNSRMADSKIINYNVPNAELGFVVECGVAYGSDLEKVERIGLQVARQVLNRHDPIKDFEPLFRYQEFGDSSINFKVIMKTKTLADSYLVKHEFIKALKKSFDKEGIEIPFPQTDVHFDDKFYKGKNARRKRK
jgi:small-conductance mechanosensitive channel